MNFYTQNWLPRTLAFFVRNAANAEGRADTSLPLTAAGWVMRESWEQWATSKDHGCHGFVRLSLLPSELRLVFGRSVKKREVLDALEFLSRIRILQVERAPGFAFLTCPDQTTEGAWAVSGKRIVVQAGLPLFPVGWVEVMDENGYYLDRLFSDIVADFIGCFTMFMLGADSGHLIDAVKLHNFQLKARRLMKGST